MGNRILKVRYIHECNNAILSRFSLMSWTGEYDIDDIDDLQQHLAAI